MRNTVLWLGLSASLASAAVFADTVFSWQDGRGTAYSDVPRQMAPAKAQIFDVRTQTVTAPQVPAAAAAASDNGAGESVADKQEKLNAQLAAQNKAIEEQNKKIQEENKKKKEEACKTAKMNLSIAQTGRVNNRDDLIKRYREQVNSNCN